MLSAFSSSCSIRPPRARVASDQPGGPDRAEDPNAAGARSGGKRGQEGFSAKIRERCRGEDPQVRGGARGESRTPTPFRAPDPKSGASAVPPLSRWLKL